MRRLVNVEQLKGLVEYLKEHQDLAKGLMRGRRALQTLKLWNVCAKKLNACKDGAIKDGRAWSRYWCDWKYRVRRRALELKNARDNNKPPPDSITPLSDMEKSILEIIGGGAVDNVVIKTDPLGENTDEISTENHDDSLAFSQTYEPTELIRARSRKRRHSPRDSVDLDDRSGPSGSPVERKNRTNTKNGESSDKDEAAEFLHLEKQKLDNSRKLCDTVQKLTNEVTRLADIMGHIRDVLVNRRVNI